MPLKILLADDSPAIKKVIQLSLQDFGVELKTVSSGKDVIEVARQFRPHIAFIDVLLPQKSGYEVANEMREDDILSQLPIVLLWSAFMAFDEKKFKSSGAQGKLEKPFEVQTLRSLVKELVPITKTSPIVDHLEFPNLEFDQPIGAVPPVKNIKPQAAEEKAPTAVTNDEWSMSAFQDIGAFAEKKAPMPEVSLAAIKMPGLEKPMEVDFGDNDWFKKDLKNAPAPMQNDEINFGEALPGEKPQETSGIHLDSKIVESSFVFRSPEENQEVTIRKSNAIPSYDTTTAEAPQSAPSAQDLSAQLPHTLTLEELSNLKKETRDIIEKVVWKLVPELAAKMIREEIIRLLSEEK